MKKKKLERDQEIKAALAEETANMAVEQTVGEGEAGQAAIESNEESKLEPIEASVPDESQSS